MASTLTPSHPASSTGFAAVSTSPDVRLFYSVTPALPLNPARPVVVLSNALAATASLWDAFVAEFSRSHTVVRYDARFHGQSPLSSTADYDYTAGHSIDDLADDVIAILDTLQISSADAFVGLSIGGGVGVSLAARYPERFGAFVIVSTRSHASLPDDADRFTERISVYREQGAQAQAEQTVLRWFGADWVAANQDTADHVTESVAQTPVEGILSSTAALTRLDLREQAAAIGRRHRQGQPRNVLFVAGANDAQQVRTESQQLATAAASPLTLVPNSGHIVSVQQPARFHDIVRAWLTKE